jgi:murein DD-endopeptidase MepM/ murein hydrolase activator NlpD
MKYLVFCFVFFSLGLSQVLPDGADLIPFECPAPENQREPQDEMERLEQERRAKYRQVLPAYFAAVPDEPVTEIFMPVEGIKVKDIADTWGSARSEGRSHEGQDIFAPTGTPIYSGTDGFVYRIGENRLGGNTVVVIGSGGWRFYYAHLSAYADVREGQAVSPETLLGYVGNTGNAISTPPHLHLGIYTSEPESCDWVAINPLPFLVDRP